MTAAGLVAVVFAVAAGVALVAAVIGAAFGDLDDAYIRAAGTAWVAVFVLAASHLYRRQP